MRMSSTVLPIALAECRFAARDAHHLPAVLDELPRYGGADAGARAGDDGKMTGVHIRHSQFLLMAAHYARAHSLWSIWRGRQTIVQSTPRSHQRRRAR